MQSIDLLDAARGQYVVKATLLKSHLSMGVLL